MLPFALSRSDRSLGAHWAFSFQPVLLSVWRSVVLLSESGNLGQAINAVTGTRLWAFVFSLPGTVSFLGGRGHGPWAAVVQRFVHFSAHP